MASTAAELKALLDAWTEKYVKQTVDFKEGSSVMSARLDELFNLLIQQGDDTVQTLDWVRDYIAAYLVEHTAEHAAFLTQFQTLYNNTVADNTATEIAVAGSAALAHNSELAAKASEDAAKLSETNALAYKDVAVASATASDISEANALASETAASDSAVSALASKNAAALSETNAATSAADALASKIAAVNAQDAATYAKSQAILAETNTESYKDNALVYRDAAAASAMAAEVSKNQAATQASNASTFATNAANSAANAENAVASVVRYFDNAGGTANALTVATATFTDRYHTTFIASANNNGTATTINGKPFYKPGTTTAPTLVSGKAYTIWYSQTGDCFFIKASAEGTATASHVLATRTFSNDTDTGIQGSMPNRTGETASIGSSVVNSTIKLKPQEGYFDGINSYVTATDGNYVASNIKAGQPIFGKVGSFTSDANAVAGDILSGKTAYTNGVKLTGTIPTIATNTSPEVVAYWAPGAVGNPYGTAHMRTPPGYYPWGTYLSHAEPDLIADNVRNGKTIFTMVGTGPTKKAAGGVVTSSAAAVNFTYALGTQNATYFIEVGGLTFKPYTIIAFPSDARLSVYYAGVLAGLNDCVHTFSSMTGTYSGNVVEQCFQANTNPGYVNTSGFKIPVFSQSASYTWIAYE